MKQKLQKTQPWWRANRILLTIVVLVVIVAAVVMYAIRLTQYNHDRQEVCVQAQTQRQQSDDRLAAERVEGKPSPIYDMTAGEARCARLQDKHSMWDVIKGSGNNYR